MWIQLFQLYFLRLSCFDRRGGSKQIRQHARAMPICARIRKSALSGPNYDLIGNSCFSKKKKVQPIIETVYEFRENLTKQTECVICLEKLFQGGRNTISLSCDHFFHADCLRTYSQHYLKTYDRDFCCPLCRTNDTYWFNKYLTFHHSHASAKDQ